MVARQELDDLKDLVFVLQCAVNDVRNELQSARHTKDSLAELLDWFLEAAEPVANACFGLPADRPKSPLCNNRTWNPEPTPRPGLLLW